MYRNVYIPKGIELTPITRAKAAWLWAGRQATLGGLSAAALLGTLWIEAKEPAELFRVGDDADGIVLRRGKLADDEVCVVDGMPVTTPARTAFDLGRRNGRIRAVVRLDALSQATGLQPADVHVLVMRYRGARGIVQLREVLNLVDGGAESPQETRTRLVLIDGGLPRPQTQIVVCDATGYEFARVDMGWKEWRVGVEYDGIQHWTDPERRAGDIDRQAKLDALGWRIVRVSAEMLRDRRWVIVDRAYNALRAAGWRGEITLNTRKCAS